MNSQDITVPIKHINGGVWPSAYAGKTVIITGFVTAVTRRGFFLQTPQVQWDKRISDAIFVYSRAWVAQRETMLEVRGDVIDYMKHDTAKPITQIHFDRARLLPKLDDSGESYPIDAICLSNDLVTQDTHKLATLLQSLAGMLVTITKGQTFIAPSNIYGDYVVALDSDSSEESSRRTSNKGVLASSSNPLRWYPGFRIKNYNHAPRLNVGAKLLTDITGPLNYRADSYQLLITDPFKFDPSFIGLDKTSIEQGDDGLTVMTLNCFNLDPHVESESKVVNPRRDVDDDWGEGRFHTLAQAVVLQAGIPDIIALQEIQDNDGAQISDVVDANKTLELLIDTIEELSEVRYRWTCINPELGEDGGQPGGNIRNAFLYNASRVGLLENSTRVFGENDECFVDSRKPLVAYFKQLKSKQVLACINIHLASKRHQRSIFALDEAGVDGKLSVRVAQARRIAQEIEKLRSKGMNYYVTGDFNDTEYSSTLIALLGDHSYNLVNSLDELERYDYNHRGKLQVLMHGIVAKENATKAEYEIIHGNELIGVEPGEINNKPSDHAYVIAKLPLTDH